MIQIKNSNSNRKAIIYCRVSTKEQEKEGYSLDVQREKNLKYAEDNNLEVVEEFSGQESAWNEKKERKLFNKMTEFVRENKVKNIIFYSRDRATRRFKWKDELDNLMTNYDVTIHYSNSNEKIDKNIGSSMKMNENIQTVFNTFFSDFVSEKTRPGMLKKAQTGVYPANAPLGYLNNKVDKTIELDTKKAPLIKELFEYAASGKYSLLMLEEEFYIKGLRSKAGKRVHKSALHRILRNTFYYGYFAWSRQIFKGTHTPIVSKELWDKANKRLKDFYRPHKTKHDFAFKEILKCEHCDCRIVGEEKEKKSKRRYTYYHCSKAKECSSEGAIREEALADKFAKVVKAVSIPKDMCDIVNEGIRILSDEKEKLEKSKREILTREKIQAEKDLKKLYEREFAEEEMNDTKKQFYRNKEKELSLSIATATKELEIFGAKREDILNQNDNMIELIYGLEDLYNQCDYKEKGEIVKLVLDTENSILTLDKDLKVKYKKPFDIFVEIGEDLNTSIAIDKTDTVIDFKDYVKYIFGKFDVVSEFKSNFYKILGINKNNISLTTDVIPKDLLFNNSINFFTGYNHTRTGG